LRSPSLFFFIPPRLGDKLDDIKGARQLIVGVTESSPPFSFRDGARGIVATTSTWRRRSPIGWASGSPKVSIINAERIPAARRQG